MIPSRVLPLLHQAYGDDQSQHWIVANASTVLAAAGTLSLSETGAPVVGTFGTAYYYGIIRGGHERLQIPMQWSLFGESSCISAAVGELAFDSDELLKYKMLAGASRMQASVGALAFDSEQAVTFTVSGAVSRIQAAVEPLEFVSDAPSEFVVDGNTTAMQAAVEVLHFTSETPTGFTVAGGASAVQARVGGIAFVQGMIDQAILVGTASLLSAEPGALELLSQAETGYLVHGGVSQAVAELGSLAFTSGLVPMHTLAGGTSIVEAAPYWLKFTSYGAHVLGASTSAVEAKVETSLSFTTQGGGSYIVTGTPSLALAEAWYLKFLSMPIADGTLAGGVSGILAKAGDLALTSIGSGAHTISGSTSAAIADVGSLWLTSDSAGGYTIAATKSSVIADPGTLSFDAGSVGEFVVDGTTSVVQAETGALWLTTATESEYTVSAVKSSVLAAVGTLGFVAQGPTAFTISANTSSTIVVSGSLGFTSVGSTAFTVPGTTSAMRAEVGMLSLTQLPPVVVTTNAGCFKGETQLWTNNFTGGFLASPTGPQHGYLSVYYKYDLLNLNPSADTNHVMVVFGTKQSDDFNTEDTIEFGIGKQPGRGMSVPDLFFRKNDAVSATEFWTDLDSDGGPDLYDGAWHHLLYGCEYPYDGDIYTVTGVSTQFDIITLNATAPANGTPVRVTSTTNNVPAPLVQNGMYYIRASSGNTCKLSTENNDSHVVNLTSVGGGTIRFNTGIIGGRGWYFYVDGVQYSGYEAPWAIVNAGLWFRHVQDNGTNNQPFAQIDHASSRIEFGQKYLWGCIDEMMLVNNRNQTGLKQIDDQLGIGYIGDATYLANKVGNVIRGRLIPQVQATNHHGLWNDVYAAWQYFDVSGGDDEFGHEYRNIHGDGRYELAHIVGGYGPGVTGIPGQ